MDDGAGDNNTNQKAMTDQEQTNLRIAIAEKLVQTMECCRCSEASIIIRYAAAFCSEKCADKVSDFALEDGQGQLPDYLCDPAAALLLVERMRKEGWHWNAKSFDEGIRFEFTKFGEDDAIALESTFPLAVAKAFAAANNINPQP